MWPASNACLPQVGADQGLRAVRKRLFDRYDHNRRRLLAADRKTTLKRRIGTDPSASIDAVNLVCAGHEEDKAYAGVLDKIPKAIDPVVAATIGNKERSTIIQDLHEASLVALRRTVEALVAAGGKNQKWSSCDKSATSVANMVKFQSENPFRRLCVMYREAIGACYECLSWIGHSEAPSACNKGERSNCASLHQLCFPDKERVTPTSEGILPFSFVDDGP